jgi:septal ring factor EnvC (AmiA/AmiB activator)|tara:strand:- start:11951 stop:12535 length:585 start_codon:yes stop_codon:yes gene_type:complete
MPYTSEQIRSSDYYVNVEDSDKRKHLKLVQEESQRLSISGSIDATNPLRDEDGVLLSLENPDKKGESIEQPYQYVRIPVEQKSSTPIRVLKFFGDDLNFTEIFPKEVEEEEGTSPEEIEALKQQLQEQIETNKELNKSLEDAIEQVTNQSLSPEQKAVKSTKSTLEKIKDKVGKKAIAKAKKKVKKFIKKLFGR